MNELQKAVGGIVVIVLFFAFVAIGKMHLDADCADNKGLGGLVSCLTE